MVVFELYAEKMVREIGLRGGSIIFSPKILSASFKTQ